MEELDGRLEAHFGEEVKVLELKRFPGGWETELYAFDAVPGDGEPRPLILRSYFGGPAKCVKEFHLLARLSEVGYPTPLPLFYVAEGGFLGRPYLVMERILGPTLEEHCRALGEEGMRTHLVGLACLLAKLHGLDPAEFQGVPGLKPINVAGETARMAYSLAGNIQGLDALARWIGENGETVCPQPPSLLHMDFHGVNVLVRPGGGLAVVDWGGAALGDPRADLGWTLMLYQCFAGPETRRQLLEAYEEAAGGRPRNVGFFEALAAAVRLMELWETINQEHSGKPGVERDMSDYQGHFQRVYELLVDKTGLEVPGLKELVDSL